MNAIKDNASKNTPTPAIIIDGRGIPASGTGKTVETGVGVLIEAAPG